MFKMVFKNGKPTNDSPRGSDRDSKRCEDKKKCHKELPEKTKAGAKDSKVKAPVTVAAVSKNTPHNKKSKNAG